MDYVSTVDAIIEEFKRVGNVYGILLYGSGAPLYKQEKYRLPKNTSKAQKDPKDIDLILVLDFPFVVSRDSYEQVAESTKRARELSDYRLDLSVCDRELPKTEFITWPPLTVDLHFPDSSLTILGKEVGELFSDKYFIHTDRFPITKEQFPGLRNIWTTRGYMAWNLHGIRRRTVDYKYNVKYYKQAFDLSVEIAVGSMTNFLRNSVFLKNGKWYNSPEEILEAVKEEFRLSIPDIEIDEDNVKALDFDSKVDALFDSLKIREEIIQSLCKK